MAAQSGRGASRAILIALARSRFPVAGLPLGMQLSQGGTATVGGRHSWLPCFLEFPGLCAALHRLPTLPAKGSLRASDADPQQLPDFPAKATPPRAKGRIRGLPCPAIFSGLCRRPSAVAGLPRRRRGSPPVRPTVDRAFRMALPPGDTPLPLATSGPSQGGATSVDGARTPP